MFQHDEYKDATRKHAFQKAMRRVLEVILSFQQGGLLNNLIEALTFWQTIIILFCIELTVVRSRPGGTTAPTAILARAGSCSTHCRPGFR